MDSPPRDNLWHRSPAKTARKQQHTINREHAEKHRGQSRAAEQECKPEGAKKSKVMRALATSFSDRPSFASGAPSPTARGAADPGPGSAAAAAAAFPLPFPFVAAGDAAAAAAPRPLPARPFGSSATSAADRSTRSGADRGQRHHPMMTSPSDLSSSGQRVRLQPVRRTRLQQRSPPRGRRRRSS